jgi:putative hydrolase of the HAD superfamily
VIEYLLLDLDNTLYDRRCGLGKAMGARMGKFVESYLGVGEEEADSLRRQGLREHGTTLRWLVSDHGLPDVEEFISFVHPTDLDNYLTQADRDTARETLAVIDLPASILTNAPREHADRVLHWLGLDGRFENVFDIRQNNFVGKPARPAYEAALGTIGVTPGQTLFVDDVLQYLLPFRDMGGHVVHVSNEPSQEPGIATISGIGELVSIVDRARR